MRSMVSIGTDRRLVTATKKIHYSPAKPSFGKPPSITSALLTNAFGDNTSAFRFALLNLEYQFQISEVTGGVSGGEGVGDIFALALLSNEENLRNIVVSSVKFTLRVRKHHVRLKVCPYSGSFRFKATVFGLGLELLMRRTRQIMGYGAGFARYLLRQVENNSLAMGVINLP
ncbi:hypothetical protein TcasGA2_TC013147 [Tribolium castaneum]|uniref:Uncharacterized protein n=1 Tax=Tribolium castaneum TaxID=7070 RepID=D6WNH8_TRICA|nr:hypothetical protein TcasGA2_TC013147 [Tribolium castaneum]